MNYSSDLNKIPFCIESLTDERVQDIITTEFIKAYQKREWNKVEDLYEKYQLLGGESELLDYLASNLHEHKVIAFSLEPENVDTTFYHETVFAESAGKRLVEFNSQVYDTYMSPMAKAIEGTGLDYRNIAETKPKSFEEMSKEEKFKFVNKEIDDLLAFIETNKQAKYNKWKKEFYNVS